MDKFPARFSVYWFDPEPSKGSEMRKIRPCVVISPDEMNENLKTVIVAPLTSTLQNWPFRAVISIMGNKSSVACDQIRSIDKKRLKAQIEQLRKSDQEKIIGILQAMFSE